MSSTDIHGHFITRCQECQTVLEQCRCMAQMKPVYYKKCPHGPGCVKKPSIGVISENTQNMVFALGPKVGPAFLYINSEDGKKLVSIDLRDGSVIIHEESRVDEAALVFWAAVKKGFVNT